MNMYSLFLLFVGGIILTSGDITMKKWVESSNNTWYIIGLVIYLIGMNFLAQTFKYKNIAVASVVFVLFNVITLIFVSWMFYNEKISYIKLLGIGLGLISVAILEISE